MQVCQCGAQPGYTHARGCPFPLFTDAPKALARWRAKWELNEKAYAELLHLETVATMAVWDVEARSLSTDERELMEGLRTKLGVRFDVASDTFVPLD